MPTMAKQMKIDRIVSDSVVSHWMYLLFWFDVDYFARGLHIRTAVALTSLAVSFVLFVTERKRC